jgi:sugar O-acyltransferase (sialic acid O-acetyltransferase NeuD family)
MLETRNNMQILIYGSREFAQTVAELVVDCGHEVAGFIDDFSPGPLILGTLEQVRRNHSPAEYGMVIAIGYNDLPARWESWQRVRTLGYQVPTLIHPRAYVARSAIVGEGSMLMAGSLVDARVRLGDLVVVWPGAAISHDCLVGENSFISPNATLCGYVKLGTHCFVGAGAAIVDHCEVPPLTRIKMQSSYLKASE